MAEEQMAAKQNNAKPINIPQYNADQGVAPMNSNQQNNAQAKRYEIPQCSSLFDCLAVTNVQVYPFKEGPSMGHIKGLANIVLNDQMLIRGLRVMDGENGMFVGFPNDPFYKGEDFRCICQPVTRQLREHIENCVLERYHAIMMD